MDHYRDNQALTTQQLADQAGLNVSRIRQLLIAGEIKGYKLGRDWRIPKAEAERWLETRR